MFSGITTYSDQIRQNTQRPKASNSILKNMNTTSFNMPRSLINNFLYFQYLTIIKTHGMLQHSVTFTHSLNYQSLNPIINPSILFISCYICSSNDQSANQKSKLS
uniref:Uncharacterized protein n=1 Tax=Rhizophora mucronata TaxID=61149 RepID=A0A2P2IKQ1_RHIMU